MEPSHVSVSELSGVVAGCLMRADSFFFYPFSNSSQVLVYTGITEKSSKVPKATSRVPKGQTPEILM